MFSTGSYSVNMKVHRSAVGHIIGRNGSTIKRIRRNYRLKSYNTKHTENTKYVTFFLEGIEENVLNAIQEINQLIAISNKWCQENGVEYA